MTSPIDPEMCVTTGRLMTEWFEHPEYTDDQLRAQAAEKQGIKVEDIPQGCFMNLPPEQADLQRKINAYVAGKKRRKWRGAMSQQEVAYRMNEATKMVSPDNYKFLPDDVRERTGLEVNPLWQMECLVRSGILSPKEQIQALTQLAGFTHSKAPNISHTTTTQMKPEDWLLELAKEEYDVLGVDVPIQQPYQPVERGAHKRSDKRRARRTAETIALAEFGAEDIGDLDDEDFEIEELRDE